MKFDVQVNDEERSNRPQNGFIGRDEGDLEELLDNMVIVGEDREEDIQWDRVVDDVEGINSSQDDNIRGVDQILRQDSRHGNHNRNPIRMWVNPDANEITAQIEYKPEQNTILSDADAVDAFNRMFNDEGAPSLDLQIAAEEHYLNQNSEALGSFEDIGNIKWAILEDEGAHREEAPNNRGEHLTTDTNTQFDIYGFYIEEDGKPLEPEEVTSLMNKLIRRDQFNVPRSESSAVPEIMLEYSSVEEALYDRDLEREEFNSEYARAQDIGLVNEEGNLTLKGWLSAVDLQASDIRSLENKEDVISFANIEPDHIPGEFDELTEVGNVNLAIRMPVTDKQRRLSHRNPDRIGTYRAEATVKRTDRYTEFETEDLVEEIIFGKGFGGLSISDIIQGDVRELNSLGVEKVAELMENDPFTQEEFLGSGYEQRIMDMVSNNDASLENLEVEDAEYNIKTIEQIDEETKEYKSTAERLEEALNWFGYSSTQELIEDAGWDEELEKIDESFETARAKVVEKNNHRQHVEAVFEDEEEPEHYTLKDAKQSAFGSCKYLSFELEDGELNGESENEIPISNLIIATYQKELQENGASIIRNRTSLVRETQNHEPDEFGKLGSRGVQYDLGSLEQYSDEFQEDIEKMAEEELIDFEEEEGSTYIKTRDKRALEAKAEFEFSVDRILPDNLEVEASYQQDSNGVACNDVLGEIGAALDPMSFDIESYEDIEIETEFQYSADSELAGDQQSAAG